MFEPVEVAYENVGEVVVYDMFKGTWERGEKKPILHDPAVHTWSNYFLNIQFFPQGREADYPQYYGTNGKEYKLLFTSINNLQKTSAANLFKASINDGKSFFARWTKKKIGVRKGKDIYGYEILDLFENQEEMMVAFDGKLEESGSKVEVEEVKEIDLGTALSFLPALAKQCNTMDELQTKINEMPMLSVLDLTDAKISNKALEANPELVPF